MDQLRVLIVTEDHLLSGTVAELLKPARCRTVYVENPRKALERAGREKFDLMVMDLSNALHPGDTLRRMERSEVARHLPVIVLSDHSDLEYELPGIFDFLVKPVDAERLLEDVELIRRGRKRQQNRAAEPLTESLSRSFRDFLLVRSGLHFDRRNHRILEKGIYSRMGAMKIASCKEYFDYLCLYEESRQELQKLLQYLTIGETFFFRYGSHFDTVRTLLLSAVAEQPERPIRLWSAGCATGEEPYTLAMTVIDTLPDWRRRDIRIVATDINNRMLRKAREGVYGQWAMRAIEKRFVDRFFRREGNSFVIRDEVKSLVDFSHCNLQTDDYPEVPGGFDIVFCRNVMIYFTLPTMRRVVEAFGAALRPGGHLFLGHAETLTSLSSQYERVAREGAFYYRKRDPASPLPVRREIRRTPERERKPAPAPVVRSLRPPKKEEPAPPPPPGAEQLFRQAQILFDAERFGDAGAVLETLLAERPDHPQALVMQGFILANSGRFEEGMAAAARALAVDDLLPEAYFLRGLVQEMNEELSGASDEYRKAILLKMEFVMPHYNLARINFRLGRSDEGTRELRNCLRLLEKEKEEAVIPYSGGLSREVFLAQLRRELPQVA